MFNVSLSAFLWITVFFKNSQNCVDDVEKNKATKNQRWENVKYYDETW